MKAIRKQRQWVFALVTGLLLFHWEIRAQERYLQPEEYEQWNSFGTGPSSADGVWNSYTMHHPEDRDTLYLKNIRTGFRYRFPAATGAILTPDGKWMAFRQQGVLQLLAVGSGTVVPLGAATSFEFAEGRFLLARGVDSTLAIRNLKTAKTETFKGITEYSYVAGTLAMLEAADSRWTVSIRELQGKNSLIIATTNRPCTRLQWNDAGTALAFYELEGNNVKCLHFYKASSGHRVLHPSLAAGIPSGRDISKTKLHLSQDGERVFFDLSREQKTPASSEVRVWRTADTELSEAGYGAEKKIWQPRWYVWWPLRDKVFEIESDRFPSASLTGDMRYAVLRSYKEYMPQHKFGGLYQDIYLMDLETGAIRRVIEKIETGSGRVVISPTGRYLAYYRKNNWWSYDIIKDKHSNLTAGLGVQWEDTAYDRPGSRPMYGCAGWTSQDRELLLYDGSDIWQVALQDGSTGRLTKGKESDLLYRIATELHKKLLRDGDHGYIRPSYDLSKGLLLKIEEPATGRQGVAVWDRRKGTVQWKLDDRKVLSAKRSADYSSLNVIESAFHVSPQWLYLQKPNKAAEIVKANQQQQHYAWGKAERISYEVDGKQLGGVLCYPASFDPARKYPMVVHIYEKMVSTLHDYDYPSEQNASGFNRTNLTLEGYFVLLPDIVYVGNTPGKSALDCVTAAVDKVLETGYIDNDRIALWGHSFGGFEAAYIGSQTNRFRSVIAGAGVHDLKGLYLGINTVDRSNMEKFWMGQMRNTLPFEQPGFDAEAPIENVTRMNTPLLLWTGDADTTVPSWQSKQLHAALWRLEKKSTLLVYPGEDHVLRITENKEDLASRIRQWLGHYLKGEPAAFWME